MFLQLRQEFHACKQTSSRCSRNTVFLSSSFYCPGRSRLQEMLHKRLRLLRNQPLNCIACRLLSAFVALKTLSQTTVSFELNWQTCLASPRGISRLIRDVLYRGICERFNGWECQMHTEAQLVGGEFKLSRSTTQIT